jgi:hypothetical protein
VIGHDDLIDPGTAATRIASTSAARSSPNSFVSPETMIDRSMWRAPASGPAATSGRIGMRS